MAISIHESRNLKQARPHYGQDVDLLRILRLLLPHATYSNIILSFCQRIIQIFWKILKSDLLRLKAFRAFAPYKGDITSLQVLFN